MLSVSLSVEKLFESLNKRQQIFKKKFSKSLEKHL